MKMLRRTTIAAVLACAALFAAPATADTISNPTNSYSFPSLSGALEGGAQTQYIGQTFTAPVTGALTNFQFTLNSSSLTSLYGVVYAWNGSKPGAKLWRSAVISGAAGLKDFNPAGVTLAKGQTYVAFLGTYGIAGNAGSASVGTCLTFVGCTSNSVPNLGTMITGNVYADGVEFKPVINNAFDATFSATIAPSAVPEPATWAGMMLGMGGIGVALRSRQRSAGRRRHAA